MIVVRIYLQLLKIREWDSVLGSKKGACDGEMTWFPTRIEEYERNFQDLSSDVESNIYNVRREDSHVKVKTRILE